MSSDSSLFAMASAFVLKVLFKRIIEAPDNAALPTDTDFVARDFPKTTSLKIKRKEALANQKDGKELKANFSIVKIFPWFILGFLALAVINSTGIIPAEISRLAKAASKFLMVSALAAIGLNTSLTDFKKAGLAPMFYGITIDTLVTLTALGVIWIMGLM